MDGNPGFPLNKQGFNKVIHLRCDTLPLSNKTRWRLQRFVRNILLDCTQSALI